MRRRQFVLGTASLLAAPAVARAAASDVLRYVATTDVASIDPIWTTAQQTRDYAFLVYDTLYGLDDSLQPSPQMVEGHVVEADGLTWRLRLRDGLKFHDGTPVLARDCAASIRRWGRRDGFGQTLMEATNEVSAADDRTIVFRLKNKFPLLPAALAKYTPSPCAIMPERLAMTDPFKSITDPTGSGPYKSKLDERVPGSQLVFERFDGYVPRPSGVSQGTAGPKIAHFPRVLWQIIPDESTGASALMRGEVDWVRQPISDLIGMLRKSPGIITEVLEPLGNVALLRFNHQAAPFNNPAVRRALLPAIAQVDYMTATCGDDRESWRDGVGFLAPGTEFASDAGLDKLTSPRDLGAAKAALASSGYNNERVVIMSPADYPVYKQMSDVSADLLKRIGFNVDLQSMDWATLLQRRVKPDPVSAGGWSIFHTQWNGLDTINPAIHVWMRGNGMAAPPGWPVSPKFEAMRLDFLSESDPAAQKKLAAQMQAQAFEDLPYIPLGQIFTRTAYRSDLTGMLRGVPIFWNIRRTA
jgi:peptide/nickel transport system substrate-binding protein